MALPKRRQSRSRTRKRKSSKKIALRQTSVCPQCGSPKIPHRVCSNCGHYGEKQVLKTPGQEKE